MKAKPKLLIIAMICFPLAEADASTITLDGYPPLGGVTFSGSGNPGRAAGRTWTFTNFDFTAFDRLWYGLNTATLPKLSMNSGPEFTVGENLSFSAGDSDLAGGIAVWNGESDFSHFAPSLITVTLPTRFTMTLSGAGATEFALSDTLLAIDPGFDTSQEILAEVTGDFSIRWLAEAFKDGAWTPVLDLFDAESTMAGDSARVDYGAAFYSTAIPEPSTALLGALGCLAVLRRRRT